MLAMILTSPPHSLQVSISILKTRFSLCAQIIEARFSAGVWSGASWFGNQGNQFGDEIQWLENDMRRAGKTTGSVCAKRKKTPESADQRVPLRQGVFNS